MIISYQDTQVFEAPQLERLFLSVGWSSGKYPDKLKAAMEKSHSVISAWDGDRLVGLINCLSDGVMTAYFHYLLVDPEYQGQGVGRTLVQIMMEKYEHYMRRVLICDNPQAGFYIKCGFIQGTGTSPMFSDADDDLAMEVQA